MKKQTNLPYVFPIFKGSVEVYVSVLVIVISDVQVPCEFLFFLRIKVYAQNMEEEKFQEHNEATRDFLFVDPSHGSFVNGGILASFLFQICRSSR